jgi:PAS domain S-box-containing protein
MKAQIVDANPALCQMLGYQREELCGKRFTDYISPQRGDVERYKQLMTEICIDAQQRHEKPHLDIERAFLHRDGRLVWTRLSVSVIPGSSGEPEYFLAIIDDITERKQTEMKLRASQAAAEAGSRAKSEFLATMSHELRTPLNAIMGLSQLLQQEIVGSLNEKQQEYISCIYSSGEHLLALINDILDLSKVEAGKEELFLIPLLIIDVCNDVLLTVRDRAIAKGLKITQEIDPDAHICIADDRRIKQMLLNLLTNAIKFTSVGEVSLIVKRVPQGTNFIISDTGIGIDSSHFSLLFEPFKQLDSRLNRQYEGTGLGLALTRKLARLHGGDVTVKSTLGVGSEFTLFLPDQEI